jgi:FAD/FMN-containing dehydrogenase
VSNFEPFFDAADLTACVSAESTPAQLNALGAPVHAWFPVYLDPEQGFGDLFLHARFSSRSFRFGSLGDNVLGLRWKLPNGRSVDFGGRVVKNVVGFDFVRFLGASQGRFGRPETLVLRLRPRAVAERVLRFEGPWDSLQRLARLVRSSSWAHAIDALDLYSEGAAAAIYASFAAKPALLPLFDDEAQLWAKQSGTQCTRVEGLHARQAHPWARLQAPQDLSLPLAEECSQALGCRFAVFLGQGLIQFETPPADEAQALALLAKIRDRLAPLGGHIEHPAFPADAAAPPARWEAALLAALGSIA